MHRLIRSHSHTGLRKALWPLDDGGTFTVAITYPESISQIIDYVVTYSLV